MADDTIYTLSEASIRKLADDHRRLEGMVQNLRAASHQTFAGRQAPELYTGTTATNADNPVYPDSPANTFVVRLSDVKFDESVGEQSVSKEASGLYVVARTHDGSYVAEGTEVLLEKRTSRSGPRWWIIPASINRQPVMWFNGQGHDPSSGTNLYNLIDGSTAAFYKFREYIGTQSRNGVENLYGQPDKYTFRVTKTGLFRITVKGRLAEGNDGHSPDLEAGLTKTFNTTVNSGHAHSVDVDGVYDSHATAMIYCTYLRGSSEFYPPGADLQATVDYTGTGTTFNTCISMQFLINLEIDDLFRLNAYIFASTSSNGTAEFYPDMIIEFLGDIAEEGVY